MKIDFNDPFVQGVIASLVAAVIFALFGRFFKMLKKSGVGLFDFLRYGWKEKTGLDTYLNTLAEKTLRISHPWMKEDQFLTDILVPIYFKVNKMAQREEREELETYLAREYRKNPGLRLVITGKPGSGKTIAMRVMARAFRTFKTEIQPVPVLMAFTDIKGLDDPRRLEHVVIEKLKFYQFEKGENNNTAENFVRDNLYTGRLFLLFDGFDELDKAGRESAAKLLNSFLNMYPRVPAVISSRTAVYENEPVFDLLKPCKISMAPFTPFAILKFLSLWKFESPKSARALFEMINGKAHLSEMAVNPLMLTIIAFLYSLPKYTLPDNRVEFYERCTRALLEEWDRSQQRDRANRFESHQKIAVLNRLAFQHIETRGSDDEAVHAEALHVVTREEMARLSLKKEEYPLLEKEIWQNSGLLQVIPPDEYRFPHRTFMEFFAAAYLDKDKEKSAKDILDLYDSDPKKWKEVVLLYLGLNKNTEYADFILKRLAQDFEKSLENGRTPDYILFSALTQCAVPDPHTASDILNLARKCLITRRKPVKEVVEELGYIAANPRWAYATQAKEILLELLKKKLPDPVFQQVVFSLLHAGDKTLEPVIFDNLKRINLVEFLAKLGTQNKYFIQRLFALDIPLAEKEKLIEGLKEAGNLELLGVLLIENHDKAIKERAAYSLWCMSKLDGFYTFLDQSETGLLEENIKKEIDARYDSWGWRWDKPGTTSGKKFAHLICATAANWIEKNRGKIDDSVLEQVDRRFRYLSTGILVEKGKPFNTFNLIGFGNRITASTRGLKKYWKKIFNLDDINDILLEARFWRVVFKPLFIIIDLIAIVGYILYIEKETSNWFYRFFFDSFTVKVVFYQFFLSFFIGIFLTSPKKENIDKLTNGILGPVNFIERGIEYIPVIQVRCLLLILSYLLAIGSIIISFHTVLFNIVFSISFLLRGQYSYEIYHIGFRLFSDFRIAQIYFFLSTSLSWGEWISMRARKK